MSNRHQLAQDVVERDLPGGTEAQTNGCTDELVDAISGTPDDASDRGEGGTACEEPSSAENITQSSDEGEADGTTEGPVCGCVSDKYAVLRDGCC